MAPKQQKAKGGTGRNIDNSVNPTDGRKGENNTKKWVEVNPTISVMGSINRFKTDDLSEWIFFNSGHIC